MRDPLLLLKSYLSEQVKVLTRHFAHESKPDGCKSGNLETIEQLNHNLHEFKGVLVGFDEHWNIGLLIDEEIIVIKGEIIVYIGQE